MQEKSGNIADHRLWHFSFICCFLCIPGRPHCTFTLIHDAMHLLGRNLADHKPVRVSSALLAIGLSFRNWNAHARSPCKASSESAAASHRESLPDCRSTITAGWSSSLNLKSPPSHPSSPPQLPPPKQSLRQYQIHHSRPNASTTNHLSALSGRNRWTRSMR